MPISPPLPAASSFDAWARVQLARHPKRPHALDYLQKLVPGFKEIHGDRCFGDDAAIVCGFGLLRERAVYAHCIHLDDADRQLMRATGAAAAVSPTSNLFLGSGFFDYAGADRIGMRYGLASDVGGGTSFSPFHTMLAAYYAGREGQTKPGLSLKPSRLWWLHTGGAARALGLEGVIGTLQPGSEADFVLLDPKATPLLARKTEWAQNLEELLFALIVLGDDRVVDQVVIA